MKPGSRQIRATWDTSPGATDTPGEVVLVLRLPSRVGMAWTDAQRRKVAQVVGDSALHALYSIEQDGVKP